MRLKTKADYIIKIMRVVEYVIACILILSIFIAAAFLIKDIYFEITSGTFVLEELMNTILTVIVGVEFVKMLILQTPESVIEVLLFAVARQIIMSHTNALENLLGIIAIAIIFCIRKFLLSDIGKKQKCSTTDKSEA